MNAPDDPTLRELFHATHRHDEESAPSFDPLWSTVSTRHHRRQVRARFIQWTAIAALLVVTAVLSIHRSSPPRASATTSLPWRSVVLLSDWQAPTDTLLSSAEPTSFSLELHP